MRIYRRLSISEEDYLSKNLIGVYALRFNSQVYIGSTTVSFSYRLGKHSSHMILGKHPNKRIQEAYNEYGIPIFTIIEIVSDASTCKDREQHYMDTIRPQLNIEPNAHNSTGRYVSDETRAKITLANTGRTATNETKQRMRLAQLGRVHPDHVKRQIGLSNTILSDVQQRIVYRANMMGLYQKYLAEIFNISQQTVSNIVLKFRNNERIINNATDNSSK